MQHGQGTQFQAIQFLSDFSALISGWPNLRIFRHGPYKVKRNYQSAREEYKQNKTNKEQLKRV